MNTSPASTWKILGLLACTFAFNVGLQAATTVKILATDPTALEGTSSGSFTLIRNGNTNSDLAVNVDISGTAADSVDYTTISTPITIPAGYLAVDVLVQPIIDTVTRGNKTVILTLQAGNSYSVAGHGSATVKIVDDIFDVPPPSITLTSPADGSVFTTPATVTLSADVESEVSIQRVGFYVDDKLVATLTNAPYSFVWSSSSNGKHNLFARAVDEFDKAGVSDTEHVTLSATPVITLVSPSGNEAYDNEGIEIDAQVSDPNESISSVAFYVNKKLVSTATSAPFSFEFSEAKTGTYSVTAIATDANTGKTGTSTKLAITTIPFVGGGD